MANHDYSAEEALQELQSQIAESSPELAAIIEEAMLLRAEELRSTRKVSDGEEFLLSDEERIAVVLSVLEAYFVEQPKIIASAYENFGAIVQEQGQTEGENQGFSIEIDLTEVNQAADGRGKPLQLERIEVEDLKKREEMLEKLKVLTNFGIA